MRLGRTALRRARVVFGVAGVAFLLLTIGKTWGMMRGGLLPSAESLAAAGLVLTVAVWCVTRSWASLVTATTTRESVSYYFMVAQLGKYIPGGLWQYAGQIGFASRSGLGTAAVTVAVPCHALAQATAAAAVGVVLVLKDPHVHAWWMFPVLAAGGIVALWHLQTVAGLAGSRSRVLANLRPEDIPPPAAVCRALGWSLCGVAGSGLAFALLLRSIEPDQPLVHSAAVFCVAWLGGFVAVLVPAGLGVREGLMIGLLAGRPEAIAAASIGHRLLNIAAEIVVTLLARARAR